MIGGALFGLATVAYSRGEYTPALGFYREALAIYEKQEDGTSIGRAVVSIGNVQYLQAEYDAATASYRRALSVLLAAGDPQGATFARERTGPRVRRPGRHRRRRSTCTGRCSPTPRAAADADPRLKTNVAPLESIGDIHFRLGNIDQARAPFDEARTLYEATPSSQGRVSASSG